jgi:predicted metal-dependent peptidase
MEEKKSEKTEIEKRDITPGINPNDALSACLQWACSPRGGNNFYGRILNSCGRRSTPGLGTVGVALTREGKYLFLWDRDWFVAQDAQFQILCIVHEAGHLVLQHCERMLKIRLEVNDNIKAKRLRPVMNVAADMAVNDVALRGMFNDPKMNFSEYKPRIILPEDKGYPVGQCFEEYFALLLNDLVKDGFDVDGKEVQQKMKAELLGEGGGEGGEGGEGDKQQQSNAPGKLEPNLEGCPEWYKQLLSKNFKGDIDWQDIMDDMTDAEIERVVDRAHKEGKAIVRSAIEQSEKNRGTIPAGLQGYIDNLLEDPTVPWHLYFRALAKSAISAKLEESTAYPNTALLHLEEEGIEPYPGYQKDFSFNIAVGVDTSGSVSDDEFRMFVRELLGITKVEKGINMRLLMFDAALQYEKELTDEDAEENRTRACSRYGYGGTSFTPFLKYLCHKDEEEDWAQDAVRLTQPRFNKIDLAILFTDGYAPVDTEQGGPIPEWLPKFPLIWCLTPSGQEHEAMKPRVVKIQEMG